MYGRKKIYTDVTEITDENVVSVLTDAMNTHGKNMRDIEYLYGYYKGITPILGKTKKYRTDVNNIVNENRAAQIVEFYEGYAFGEPIQYVRRGDDESKSDDIDELNTLFANIDKESVDRDLAHWLLICGVADRMTLPDISGGVEMYCLDPRYAFNVYYNGLGSRTMASVSFVKNITNGEYTYSVYTDRMYYKIRNGIIIEKKPHIMGFCPIVEYELNDRLGIFELALPLLDSLSMITSNRVDDVQQFVDSILCIIGGSIDEETMRQVEELKAMSLPQGVDAKYLTTMLTQSDTQTLKNDIVTAIFEITGIPNRNGGSSTSDTGNAVFLRDGWESANSKCKIIETSFKKSEREMLRRVFALIGENDISVGDVEIKFTRRNYEAIATKSTVLTQMLSNNMIHPELAFTSCGLFADPLSAYKMSMEWNEGHKNVEINNDERDPMPEL